MAINPPPPSPQTVPAEIILLHTLITYLILLVPMCHTGQGDLQTFWTQTPPTRPILSTEIRRQRRSAPKLQSIQSKPSLSTIQLMLAILHRLASNIINRQLATIFSQINVYLKTYLALIKPLSTLKGNNRLLLFILHISLGT